MIALALLAAGAMAYVPAAALAGILVYHRDAIFRVGEMVTIYRRGGREILLVVASAALVVVLPIESGMLLASCCPSAQPLYRRPARLRGAGAGARHHGVVDAGEGGGRRA